MNDQKIYTLMAKTPDIRAVQIADALDQELSDVSDALKSLVDVGDVVRHAGTAPNGQPTQLYNLSPSFVKSSEYKTIKAGFVDVSTPIVAAAPVPQPAASIIPPAAPVSRVDGAIAFIRLSGKVSGAELKRHMGLSGAASPGNYLNTALRDGRLARDGIYWMIGPAKPANKEPEPKVAATTERAPETAAIPVPALPANEAQHQVAPASSPTFRCGLWSDDVLELQRDGETLATLTRTEGEQLSSFFNRMISTMEVA
jgi:hypothetical protein